MRFLKTLSFIILLTFVFFSGIARNFTCTGTCFKDTAKFVIDDITGITSVSWDFGDPASGANNTSTLISPTHIFSATGFYNVTVTINGGAESINNQIGVNPLPTTGNSLLYACKGITVILKTDTQNVMSHYLWHTGATTQSVTFRLLKDTTWWVWNYDSRECRAKGYFWVKAITINPNFSINQPNQCLVGNNFVFTNQTNTTVRPWIQFSWSFGDGGTDVNRDASHTYGSAGTFPVRLIAWPQDTQASCADTITKMVNLFNQVPPTFTADVNRCNKTVVFTNTSGPAQNYYWDFGNGKKYFCKDTTERYSSMGKYTVKMYTNLNTSCTDSDSVVVDIGGVDSNIFIPNAFSPNKDGINDGFKVVGLDYECLTYKLLIYNRWGEKIFDSSDMVGEPVWDGFYNGTRVEQGVYYYSVIGKHFTKWGCLTVLP